MYKLLTYKAAFTAINSLQYMWQHSAAENDSNLILNAINIESTKTEN